MMDAEQIFQEIRGLPAEARRTLAARILREITTAGRPLVLENWRDPVS